jgi:peroxiredoxin (alkyl hydroperoxide reductase subunit C)
VHNVPSLGGITYPLLSDFYPHGAVADLYGVLRGEGFAERALFIIDKQGIIRYIDVHDINTMPKLEALAKELEKLQK